MAKVSTFGAITTFGGDELVYLVDDPAGTPVDAKSTVDSLTTHFQAGVNKVPTGGTTSQVLSKVDGTNYNVTWTTPSAGGGGGIQESLGFMSEDAGTFSGFCSVHGTISSGADGGVVLQALIDHCSNYVGGTGHRGGRIHLGVDEVLVTAPVVGRAVDVGGTTSSTTVWPLHLTGNGVLPRPSAISGEIGGTIIRWNSGSVPTGTYQAVLDLSDDCHGWMIDDMAIDGGTVAPKCAVSAGRRVVWTRCQFRHPLQAGFVAIGTPSAAVTVGAGLLVTNGSDASSDRYVQQRVINCDFIGSSGGIGLIILDMDSGSSCTDGRIEDVQMNGCNDGGVYIGEGGWGLRGGHLTMNATGGNRDWGLYMDAGFLHVAGLYVDVVPLGANIYVGNNNFTITGCFMIANNKGTNNTYPFIDLNGSSGSVVGNTWGGLSNTVNYFVDRSNVNSVIVGNSGPSGSIGTSVINGATTNTDFNLSY